MEGIAALVSALGPTERKELVGLCGATEGDLILFAAGPVAGVRRVLDRLRNFAARALDLIPKVAPTHCCNRQLSGREVMKWGVGFRAVTQCFG